MQWEHFFISKSRSSQRRGCQPQRLGHEPITLANFPKIKLHENKNLDMGGGGGISLIHPLSLDPPMASIEICVQVRCRFRSVWTHRYCENISFLDSNILLEALYFYFRSLRLEQLFHEESIRVNEINYGLLLPSNCVGSDSTAVTVTFTINDYRNVRFKHEQHTHHPKHIPTGSTTPYIWSVVAEGGN